MLMPEILGNNYYSIGFVCYAGWNPEKDEHWFLWGLALILEPMLEIQGSKLGRY